MRTTAARIFIPLFCVLFPALLYFAFWSSGKAQGIKGPYRIVGGPGDSVYVLMGDLIVRTDAHGEILDSFSRLDLDIEGDIADMSVDSAGNMYIGLLDAGAINEYSPEGRLLRTLDIKIREVPFGAPDFFRFAISPSGHESFVAESSFNQLMIYPEGEGKARDFDFPSQGLDSACGGLKYNWPSRLLYFNNTLFMADSNNHRVVALSPQGVCRAQFSMVLKHEQERVDPGVTLLTRLGGYRHYLGSANPTALSVNGSTLYVLNKDPVLGKQNIVSVDLEESSVRLMPFSFQGAPVEVGWKNREFTPQDIYARDSDILVADMESMTLNVFSKDGQYIGPFGSGGVSLLVDKFASAKFRLRVEWMGSLLVLMVLFVGLLVVYYGERQAEKAASRTFM